VYHDPKSIKFLLSTQTSIFKFCTMQPFPCSFIRI